MDASAPPWAGAGPVDAPAPPSTDPPRSSKATLSKVRSNQTQANREGGLTPFRPPGSRPEHSSHRQRWAVSRDRANWAVQAKGPHVFPLLLGSH